MRYDMRHIRSAISLHYRLSNIFAYISSLKTIDIDYRIQQYRTQVWCYILLNQRKSRFTYDFPFNYTAIHSYYASYAVWSINIGTEYH